MSLKVKKTNNVKVKISIYLDKETNERLEGFIKYQKELYKDDTFEKSPIINDIVDIGLQFYERY